MTTAIWLSAAAIAIALGTVGPALDAQDDHSAEWPLSAELQALQASEAGTARREAAAQALCTAERGPQSEARWTPDGDLVCTARRNSARVEVVKP
jgi:hypothetical protein